MKKIIALLMLATSITGKVYAQDKPNKPGNGTLNNTDRTFELPENSITRRFLIDLGKSNKMQLELTALEDIAFIKNIDSLVKVFLHDLQPLKDSLADELLVKRIDYVTDAAGNKKIRIQQYQAKGSSFLVNGNDVAALKLEQDTINITGSFPGRTPGILSTKEMSRHYYRISFFVNQLSELSGYLDGRLQEKISLLEKDKGNHWRGINDGQLYLDKDPSITAQQRGGYFSWRGDYLEIKAGINVQNYKNYFVPSFNISANVFISNEQYKHEIGVAWEPYFLFAKNSQGNLQTFRNDFITLVLGREPIKSKDHGNEFHLNIFQQLSVGYLVRQKGSFMDDHTFRAGTGGINWDNGRIKLEPVFYFHDFFKNVTPGVRLSLNF